MIDVWALSLSAFFPPTTPSTPTTHPAFINPTPPSAPERLSYLPTPTPPRRATLLDVPQHTFSLGENRIPRSSTLISLVIMSTAARRRLMRDFKRMQTDPPAGVSASPVPDNVMTWNAVIIGPADTPFEDGTFRLVMHFEEQYPNKPPAVKFISQMFHPNVYATGELCLDILQNRWSPTYDVAAILTSIQSLLNDPNTGSPANVEASNLYKDNRKEYTKRTVYCLGAGVHYRELAFRQVMMGVLYGSGTQGVTAGPRPHTNATEF
ncbi:hypothetical protein O1611_g6824 [Lasiodiplodia mahajangana]|uniref:Uncharacterized protein n=1 Tax=Lasiodiplodia mahajangana TaxID=1108764 RepID=A0ACC2JH22_9PEZI|nr:hypothetical protein O1611_g6824 [Lasiodiplodia mahajangana]